MYKFRKRRKRFQEPGYKNQDTRTGTQFAVCPQDSVSSLQSAVYWLLVTANWQLATVFYSLISYSFSFLYNVLSLIPRSEAASFLFPLCFFSAFTISSFSLSMILSDSSTSS